MMLDAVAERIRAGERLNAEDALVLFHHPDVIAVGQLANEVRQRRHGDRTYFNRNMRKNFINKLNIILVNVLCVELVDLDVERLS